MMVKTNSDIEYLNLKQYRMFKDLNVQNFLRHLNIWILDLFRISDSEFRNFSLFSTSYLGFLEVCEATNRRRENRL